MSEGPILGSFCQSCKREEFKFFFRNWIFYPSAGGNPALKSRVYFKNNVGPSTKIGPNLIPGLKAWVHKLLTERICLKKSVQPILLRST